MRNLLLILTLLIIAACQSAPQYDAQIAETLLKLRNVGLALLEENQLVQADSVFKRIIRIAPQEALGYANSALVRFRKGEEEAALLRIKEAEEIAPQNAAVLLLKAEFLLIMNEEEKAAACFRKVLQIDPQNIPATYRLSKLIDTSTSPAEKQQLLINLSELAPDNFLVQLEYIEFLLTTNSHKMAADKLALLRQIIPPGQNTAQETLHQCLIASEEGETEKALLLLARLNNVLKAHPAYRASREKLEGVKNAFQLTPVTHYGKTLSDLIQEKELLLSTIHFQDLSEAFGLDRPAQEISEREEVNGKIILTDANADERADLFVLLKNANLPARLWKNEEDRFTKTTIWKDIPENAQTAASADVDNDGLLDLAVVTSKKTFIYLNQAQGGYQRHQSLPLSAPAIGLRDLDHDGDLDIIATEKNSPCGWINDGSGNFSRANWQFIPRPGGISRVADFAFADFDNDGDLDFFLADSQNPSRLYSNERQGFFKDNAATLGLDHSFSTVQTADFNNDGFNDLCLIRAPDNRCLLFQNVDYQFSEDPGFKAISNSITARSARFIDFDNDGFRDLLIIRPATENTANNLILTRNLGGNGWEITENILPDLNVAVKDAAVSDSDADGDLDIIVLDESGKLSFLRNNGGNANHWIKVKLLGLKQGSSKNNHYGFGARIEVRAGGLYQSAVMAEPLAHFGLGGYEKADVIRVTWTNGTNQSRVEPLAHQTILERQVLKGSCPFLYSWNGEKYVFVTDVLWRNALGMPLGIMGSNPIYAFPNSTKEYMKIPGEFLESKDGFYELKIVEELWETPYLEEVKLFSVDHPRDIEIFVDERFLPPPYPEFKIYTVDKRCSPVSVKDQNGREWLPEISKMDQRYIYDLKPTTYQGIVEPHDVIIDFGKIDLESEIVLFLNGWLFPTDASINVAISQKEDLSVIHPYLQVKDENDNWVTIIDNIYFPAGKNKWGMIDLTGKFKSGQHKVRIRTNMQIYWNEIFFTQKPIEMPMEVKQISPARADLQYRGFAKMVRNSPYSPHMFEYQQNDTLVRWRDLRGYYTRFGDVTPLVQHPDNQYVIMNSGDELTLRFPAESLPELKDGWRRDFIIYCDGWLKDGDLNTATGNTVEPLPFHGMPYYPYEENVTFPATKAWKEYNERYNTRRVDGKAFSSVQ